LAKTFVCEREGTCEEALRLDLTVKQIDTKRDSKTAKEAARQAAEEFFAEHLGHTQVEVTVIDA
jgi:hypothetical protein